MNQSQLYTDFWRLLSDVEDYYNHGRRIFRYGEPSFSFSEIESEGAPGTDAAQAETETAAGAAAEKEAGAGVHADSAISGRRERLPVAVMGSPSSSLWVISDPPGLAAEQQGLPFGPEEMESFEKWMKAIDLEVPRDLYLHSLIRFRLPGSRSPFSEEMNRGGRELLALLKEFLPDAVLALGSASSAWLTGLKGRRLEDIRGTLYFWKDIPLIVSFSPAQVLRNSALKRPVWEDLKKLRDILNDK